MGGFTVSEELVYLASEWKIVGTVRSQAVGGSDGVFYPVLTDQIGTPRVVLDPTDGSSRWEWEAKEAFGYQTPNATPGTGAAFNFDARFPGQWFDPETGLYQNGYRDYDPRTGRYVQSDPIGLGGGWNTYAYVGGQVTGAVDPEGLSIKYEDANPSQGGTGISGKMFMMYAIFDMSRKSPFFNHMISVLDASPEPYTLHALRGRDIGSGWSGKQTKQINWNIDRSISCGYPARVLPPWSGLLHETGHAYRSEIRRSSGSFEWPYTGIPYIEEIGNLEIERTVHKELGLPPGRSLMEYISSTAIDK